MVKMNWDFVAILKFSKSGKIFKMGTNRRLWDRSVSALSRRKLPIQRQGYI